MNVLQRIHSHRLELTAATTGASVMAIELIGSRLIAPYLGSSVYVWTAIIGVILGALSLGFIIGGQRADRSAEPEHVVRVILIAGVCFLLSLRLQTALLDYLVRFQLDTRIQAFIASLFLFAPASFFVGMVSPFLAKLRVDSLERIGRYMGRLEAAGTIGSIAGTFLTGYWLMGLLGTQALGSLVVVCMVLVTFLLSTTADLALRITVMALAVATMSAHPMPVVPYSIITQIDTSYSKYRIVEGYTQGQRVRMLVNDPLGIQSGVYMDHPLEPAFTYNRRFLEVAKQLDSPKKFLIIGGGTYTFPQILANRFPDAQVNVVEIDPALTTIAKHYFAFNQPANMHIINEDGRAYINQAQGTYDAVYMDAFNAVVPPFQLTTSESIAHLKTLTGDHGIVAVNIISPTAAGKARGFLAAERTTYGQHYKQVAVFKTAPETADTAEQNTLLLASDTTPVRKLTGLPEVSFKPSTKSEALLTDDYAPVEQLTH